jgi:hypothetical protein
MRVGAKFEKRVNMLQFEEFSRSTHFFLQVNGRWHCTQIFVGKFAFKTPRGMLWFSFK